MFDAIEEVTLGLLRRAPGFRGRGQLAFRLHERASQRGSLAGTIHTELSNGLRLELPRRSTMAWQVAATLRYDAAYVAEVERWIRPGSAVLDVGASLGLWSVQLGRLARRKGAVVHAFEPNPANLVWLARNLELNDLTDIVKIHDVGLGDANLQVGFGHTEGGLGNGAIAVDGLVAEQTVTVKRLDEVDVPQPISLMKIDVEGYEPAVLRGGAQRIERDRPAILGEFSPDWMKVRGESADAAVGLPGYTAVFLEATRSRAWRELDGVRHIPAGVHPGSEAMADLLLLPS